jgi:hypothetical protein
MLLNLAELTTTYYPKAKNMPDASMYLSRANAFCTGIIGGEPSTVDDTVKTAVSMAFEIFTKGETAQVDESTGNITEAAPTGKYVKNTEKDPLDVVREMLQSAKRKYEKENASMTDRGIMFL